MPQMKAPARIRLLQAAEKSTYRHGFARTSLADVAKEARFPLGNIYYYFKTKDDLGNAVVNLRVSRFRKLLEKLDRHSSPAERLCAFVKIKIKNRVELSRSGCPVGTMCSELHKEPGAVAKNAAVLFADALDWMEKQFRALGKGRESRSLAVHLLSATQGASVLAHTFHDPKFIEIESARLLRWLRFL